MNIQKPTQEELQPLIDIGRTEQSADKWAEKILDSIKAVLKKKPLRYRAYGPYWWPVKKALIDSGFLEFGEHIDMEWLAAIDYGDFVTNIAAAFAYEDARFETVNVQDWTHTLFDEDGNGIEYISSDEDMEAIGMV